MIEKQFSDFLFSEIDGMMTEVPAETAQRLQKHLKQLRNVVDSALDNSLPKSRGRKGGNA